MREILRTYLLSEGASVVGVGDMGDALGPEVAHLRRAICIGVSRHLNEDTVHMLSVLQKKAVRLLREAGRHTLAVPPDSDRITQTFISRLYSMFSHKMVATCAGVGWIGRNGLLINPEFGPRLTFVTVLTDAEVDADEPITESRCGQCRLCVEHCPAGAITGDDWSRQSPFVTLVELDKCRQHKSGARRTSGKPNCGLCIAICPYGREQRNGQGATPIKNFIVEV